MYKLKLYLSLSLRYVCTVPFLAFDVCFCAASLHVNNIYSTSFLTWLFDSTWRRERPTDPTLDVDDDSKEEERRKMRRWYYFAAVC